MTDTILGKWRKTMLDQLGQIVTGKTPPSNCKRCFGGTIPFVTPTDFDGRRIIDTTSRYLSEYGANVVGCLIPAGSVMVSCIGSDMGKAAIAGHDCVTNQQINSIIVAGSVDPAFVYYNLSNRKAEIRHAAGGSAQPILNKSAFGRLEIHLPSLPEQQAIACILGALDDKIELNRRRCKTLEAMARAIFQSWFVDFDPVHANARRRDITSRRRESSGETEQNPRTGVRGSKADTDDVSAFCLKPELAALFPDRFEDPPLGPIPAGWRVGTLAEVADNPRRGINADEIKLGTPYIALEHMPRKSITLADWSTADAIESNKFEFRRGEILFGKLRPYFHKVGVAPVDGVCSTDILVIVPKQPEWFGFCVGHFSSDAIIQHADRASTGTKMPRTNWNDLARFEVVIPRREVAELFSKQFKPMIDRLHQGIQESRTLAALRDALLPKLISGELRVPDAERIVGRAT
ncbi:MAG: restriction endonuclease subunit S [Gemmataceae bacterium]|nr:restriction endonuclease subunit S [Gemmataceae bacterium]